jgi:hypothetical protein
MRGIEKAFRYVFDVRPDRPGQRNCGGVLIWYGQRINDEYFFSPEHKAVVLDQYAVLLYQACIDKAGFRVIRYDYTQGYQFCPNCKSLVEGIRATQTHTTSSEREEIAPDDNCLPEFGDVAQQTASHGRSTSGDLEGTASGNPLEAVQFLGRLVRRVEAHPTDNRNTLYIFNSFAFSFGRSAEDTVTLDALALLSELPKKLYDLGHLLVFLSPTDAQAIEMKRDLFLNSPNVKLEPAPEPDEDSIFHRIMADQFSRVTPNAEAIACAGTAAAWLKRASHGENKPFFEIYDRLGGQNLGQDFLDKHQVADMPRIIRDLNLDELKDMLCSRIHHQEEAIDGLIDHLRQAQQQLVLRNKGREPQPGPIFRALLAGPSGTGKTYLARCLSEALFGKGRKPYEIQMQNITNRTSLVGAPAGHIGFGQVHPAIEAIHQAGSGVFLIDEWERAGSDAQSRKSIHDSFMSIFDEGTLDTEDRRQVSFQNTIVLVTTNLGMDRVDYDKDLRPRQWDLNNSEQRLQRRQDYERELVREDKHGNCIEFPWLGRLGEPIIFNPFGAEDMVRLAERMWSEELFDKTTMKQPPEVRIEDPSLQAYYRGIFNPAIGARDLKQRVVRAAGEVQIRDDYAYRIRKTPVKLMLVDGRVRIQ